MKTKSSINNLIGKTATILGAARSGIAAARLLQKKGMNVFVSDFGTIPENIQADLKGANIQFESAGHTKRALKADFIVISPGVPTQAPIAQKALDQNIPVYAEIEVASWFCKAPIIAITGSNGKTTTTSLLGHIFEVAGRPAVTVGNIGAPFSDAVLALTEKDIAILEVSSFQLDHIDTFRPNVSIVLNITPDHLDRYDYQFEKYAESKCRIFKNQGTQINQLDYIITNADDDLLQKMIADFVNKNPDRNLSRPCFSLVDNVSGRLEDVHLKIKLSEKSPLLALISRFEATLKGDHNVYNMLAASLTAHIFSVELTDIAKGLRTFAGVPHRLENVRTVKQVLYINDSKATNVDAVKYALGSYPNPLVLIIGGRDKGNDYSEILPLVKKSVHTLIAIGESAAKVKNDLGNAAGQSFVAKSMEEAVSLAQENASAGDIVLLSPACSSFDMFTNYENRGDVFKEIVRRLN